MPLKLLLFSFFFFFVLTLSYMNNTNLREIENHKKLHSTSESSKKKLNNISSSIHITFYLNLAFTFFLLFYIVHAFLLPIKKLRKKMLDFLNERYSYQFKIPSNNQVGHLEVAFHALAQKMILNMTELSEVNQAKSDFLNIASHELRTPLTSIYGSLDLLASEFRKKRPPSSIKLIEIAKEESQRLIRLINDILDLSKIEERQLAMKKSWFSLDSLFEKALRNFESILKAEKVFLHKSQNNKAISVYMDSERIYQVLSNLISNAIKHSPVEGNVFLRAFINKKDQIVIEVEDQGPGLSSSDQKAIFKKFHQLPQNKKQHSPLGKGTGLGLAISKAFIEQHGGKIGVKSSPNKGAVFYFILQDWKFEQEKSQRREKNAPKEFMKPESLLVL